MPAHEPAEAVGQPRWLNSIGRMPILASAVLCVILLLADAVTPRGVTVPIVYTPLILCALWFERPHAAYVLATVATLFTTLGLLVKGTGDPWIMGANRVMAICAIWSVAGLVSMHRKREIRHARHRSEAEKTMALLAAVVESSGDAVITNALDGRVTSWNAGAERLFGYTASEAIGQPASLIVPFDCADEERLIVAEITEGRRIESFETVHARKDGGRVHVSLTVSPIRDDHGVIIGTSKVARDITARKTAEAELLRHTLALERSNKDLDDFAYIASHDLREPLRGLANNAKFLAEDYETKLDQGGLQRLHRIGYLTRRLDQLINDLLYFSRLGRQDLAIQRTDLNAVIADIAATMSLDEHGATIEIARPLPVIVCDKPRVTEALRNLIANALKYNTSATKRIEIGCVAEMATPQGLETQVFYVKDNGVGIEKEFHDEVFRIFKRLNEEEDTKKGTGVGLTFVRKIVERHGGRIWINSKPGAGTTFYFTLHERAAHVAAA